MTIDLKSMTRKELEKLRANVDKALEKVTERERKAALAAAEKAAQAHGFSLAEVTESKKTATASTRKPAKKTKTAAPKYAAPDDKTKTWTGKGRQPDWFKAALASGMDSKDMLI